MSTFQHMVRRPVLRFVAPLLLLFGAVLLAGCSLASPAPVGTARPPEQPQAAQPVQLPSRHPSAATGASLYREKCVGCHGDLGRGDGAMAAQIQTQFNSPVADLTSDVVARARTPEEWYDIVSNGRLSNGMPGFASSLNVDQRWDVIAYAWSLAVPPQQVEHGKQVYAEQCVQCHGGSGKGDGKDAQGQLPDLSDFSVVAKVAPGIWDQDLASGHVPSFAGTVSEADRRAVIDYVRTFAYDYTAGTSSPAATPSSPTAGLPATTPSGPAEPSRIEGTIVNGTAGQAVPDNLPMTLYIVPHQGATQDLITHTFQSGVNGHFVVTTTQAGPSNLLAVGIHYKDLDFFSEVTPYQITATLPVTIYESTSDASQVKIDTLHIVAEPAPNGLSISEIYVLSNNGDRFVAGFGQPVLHFGLPAAASDLQMDAATQRVLAPQGDGLDYYEAIPVGQQSQQIVFQYTLPATATSLSRAIYQPIALVNLLVGGQTDQLKITSDQLQSNGTRTIPAAPDNGQPTAQTFQQYTAQGIQPGQTLTISIGAAPSSIDWRIVLGIALVAIGAVGLILWQRSQKQQPVPAQSVALQKDALIDQIAALDDEFAEGQLDEINYKAKRAKLKEKLLKLMDEE